MQLYVQETNPQGDQNVRRKLCQRGRLGVHRGREAKGPEVLERQQSESEELADSPSSSFASPLPAL